MDNPSTFARKVARSVESRRSRGLVRQKLGRAAAVHRARGPPRTGGFYGDSVRRARGELKVVDIASATYAANTTGSCTCLNLVAQGDDFNQRQGRKIILKSLYVRGFASSRDLTSGPNLARLIIFYDAQANGTTPVITDVLTAASSVSHLNLDNRDRFKILHDSQHAFGQVDTTATQAVGLGQGCYAIKEYIRIPKAFQNTTYNAAGGTAGAIATGGLWMLIIGFQAGTSADSTYTLSTRTRFLDV